jgi:alpha-1,3-rhamnosyl/mannosyltransferase
VSAQHTGEPPLRVVFGAASLLAPLTGIGQYAQQLAAGLEQHPGVDLTCFYGMHFSPHVRRTAVPAAVGKARVLARTFIPSAYLLRRAVEQFRFRSGLKQRQFDLYHEPNYLALPFDGPTAITAHDLSWIRYPETHPRARVLAMERHFEPTLRQAALVLTDSEFVKTEIVEHFGIAPERITAIPLGLDPVFRPMRADETAPVLKALDLQHGQYFLSVGTLEPRKNVQATLAAYGRLPAALRERFPLVIAGMKGWHTSELDRVLGPLVRSGSVRVLGYLPRSELAAVTAGATTLVYPSLYEGFGLPPLEAMGAAVPPITSNVSSLPEVVGDAGLQVQPHDIDALSQAMQRLALDEGLRATLALKSRARAGEYTWERCVARTIDAYRSVVRR